MIARFTAIPFVKGVFDTKGRETGLYAYTDQLLPTVEYTHDFQSIPFSGRFLPVYISQANLISTTFLRNLKDFQRQICDVDGIQRSDQLARFPPNIYFAKQATYELHVYRSQADYSKIADWHRSLRQSAVALTHAIHAILTPAQSAECWQELITIYAIHGNTIAPVKLPRGEFIQQIAPTANPLFTIAESGYLRSASGILCFYGQVGIAGLVDLILQTTLPDEDLIATLLTYGHLDDRTGMALHNNLIKGDGAIYCETAHHLRNKQACYYEAFGSKNLLPSPVVPSFLQTLHTN